jgi:acyl-CoA reductase-like NAD-dependent aldehyde dehydrogenase
MDTNQINQSINRLQSKKNKWINISVHDKIHILDAIVNEYSLLTEDWVELGLTAKGAQLDAYAAGWEWASGPMPILRFLQGLMKTLLALEQTGSPQLPGQLVNRPNGQVSVKVYPTNLYERISTPGTTAEIWMEPGLSSETVLDSQARAYRYGETDGKVCLVLGAGNVSCIPVNDSLSKLFIDNYVVLLKMNPVNDYLGALIETAFKPLIVEGYFQIVYGGATEGNILCNHPDIDCIHMTGSDKTYETIVFGPGKEGLQRKKEHHPVCIKPFTAELGNIAPAIIVPGSWSKLDISYQAEQLASHLCDSGSYSCSRTRLIIQDSGWNLRDDLISEIEHVLTQTPPRTAYYPGAVEQYERFVSTHPQAHPCSSLQEGTLPWTVIPNVDSDNESDICFREETFCPIIAETALEASSPADFIKRAVQFANQRVWGTLTASIIVHTKSLRDPAISQAVEWAIDQLRYGIVSINCLPGLAFSLTAPPWGSYPGNEPWDIQSGTGFIHNMYMFSQPQKTVLRGPFQTRPRPPWFPSRANRMGEICRKVTKYEADPSLLRMLDIIRSAIL